MICQTKATFWFIHDILVIYNCDVGICKKTNALIATVLIITPKSVQSFKKPIRNFFCIF